MKLRNRILLLFLLTAQLPVLLTGILAYSINKEALEQETISFLVATNLQKSTRINDWISDASQDLNYLAAIPLLREQLAGKISGHNASDHSHEQYHLAMRNNYLQPMLITGRFIEIFLLRPSDGVILISTDARQEGKIKENREYFLKGQRDPYVQNVYYSMTIRQPGMVITTPIRDVTGQLVAVLAGRLNLKDLSVIMEERSNLKATEDTYLVDPQNYFITEPRYGKNYALRKTIHTEGVKKALAGQNGSALYVDYRGVPVLGAYNYLPERKIALITEIDQEEYLIPIKRLKRTTFGVSVLMAMLSLLLGWKSADALLRPLSRLVSAVNRTGADNLVFAEKIEGKDEMSQLTRAFAAMTERLKQTLVSRDALRQEVDERKKAEKELEHALAQLNRSNKELEQFAYIASHDLQEPLRMVSSFVQLLGDRYRDKLDEKANKYIHYAVDGASRMQILIQELLAFSRVSTRGCDFERIYTLKLLAQAEDNLRVAIDEAAARISHDRLPMIYGDKTQLIQVFQNLIANAIKFRKAEPPKIHVGAEKQGDMWRFSVQDNGIGIDRQYADKIFVIFQRLHTREEYPGTGIGLSLCKRIIERHGGTIWFESELGKGSTFYFTLFDQDTDAQSEKIQGMEGKQREGANE